MTAVEAAGNVWLKYRSRLREVEALITSDALFDPKAAPNRDLIEERWKLQEKLRMTEMLTAIFSEGGL